MFFLGGDLNVFEGVYPLQRLLIAPMPMVQYDFTSLKCIKKHTCHTYI
jgi:hypothetical protein